MVVGRRLGGMGVPPPGTLEGRQGFLHPRSPRRRWTQEMLYPPHGHQLQNTNISANQRGFHIPKLPHRHTASAASPSPNSPPFPFCRCFYIPTSSPPGMEPSGPVPPLQGLGSPCPLPSRCL